MAEPELYPVRVGGGIASYRVKTSDSKSAKKKATTAKASASKPEEGTR